MPWTRKQVKLLLSKYSPLTSAQDYHLDARFVRAYRIPNDFLEDEGSPPALENGDPAHVKDAQGRLGSDAPTRCRLREHVAEVWDGFLPPRPSRCCSFVPCNCGRHYVI